MRKSRIILETRQPLPILLPALTPAAAAPSSAALLCPNERPPFCDCHEGEELEGGGGGGRPSRRCCCTWRSSRSKNCSSRVLEATTESCHHRLKYL